VIKAITFDLDGVYFPNGKKVFLENVGKLGVSEAEAKRVFLQSDEMNCKYKVGQMTDEQYWTWAVGQWKLPNKWQELVAILVSGYEVDEQVEEAVKNVRGRGYKALICSNNFPARVAGLQDKFGFLDNFDAAVFSYEVGACKPDMKIFGELVNKSGVLAEEIVYADDDSEKIEGARRLGITTFVYTNFEVYLGQLKDLGVKI
jgi:HAD superfamily hydrolase (TIGR01509 family)